MKLHFTNVSSKLDQFDVLSIKKCHEIIKHLSRSSELENSDGLQERVEKYPVVIENTVAYVLVDGDWYMMPRGYSDNVDGSMDVIADKNKNTASIFWKLSGNSDGDVYLVPCIPVRYKILRGKSVREFLHFTKLFKASGKPPVLPKIQVDTLLEMGFNPQSLGAKQFNGKLFKPDAETNHTGKCCQCGKEGVWIAGAGSILCYAHQDSY